MTITAGQIVVIVILAIIVIFVLVILGRAIRIIPQATAGVVETSEQELKRLRRENARLKEEREFAKKVAVYFAKESR